MRKEDRKPRKTVRYHDVEEIIDRSDKGESTARIAAVTGSSQDNVCTIVRIIRRARNGEEQKEHVSEMIREYCEKHGYELKFAPGIDPTAGAHRAKKDPVQTQMEFPAQETNEPDPDPDCGIYITDVRLNDAINAYILLMQNTVYHMADSDDNGQLILSDTVKIEAIKAAKDIAFKYLSMETEIARADVGNRTLDVLLDKLTEVK